MRIDPPDDLPDRDVESDGEVLPQEKEISLTFPNDVDHGLFYSNVPTGVRWLLSVVGEDGVDVEWVQVNDDGAVVACRAKIPRGIVKLQGSARKSDQFSDMVSYSTD